MFKPESSQEQKGQLPQTLESYLEALQDEGIKTLPPDEIKRQLEQTGIAIVTREFACGIRISKRESESGDQYKTWTTNRLEDPEHPLSKKFGGKEIIIE